MIIHNMYNGWDFLSVFEGDDASYFLALIPGHTLDAAK